MTAAATQLDVSHLTVDELVIWIQREHDACEVAVRNTLEHAINCGKGLLLAREMVPAGWVAWLDQNVSFENVRAYQYMRIAANEDHVRESGAMNFGQAKAAVTGLPRVQFMHRDSPRYDPAVVDQVKQLRSDGLTQRGISNELGIGLTTIRAILDPSAARAASRRDKAKDAKQRAAFRAETERLERERERRITEREARAAGGAVADAYAAVRKAASKVDSAFMAADNTEERRCLRSALSSIHKAEEQIVAALRIERAQ